MAIIFDAAIIIILALAAWRGARIGLVRALCGLLAVAISFVGAGFVARTLSPMVADSLEPKFAAAIEERLNEEIQRATVESAIDPKTGAVNPALPDDLPMLDILNLLHSMGLYEDFIGVVNSAVENGLTGVAASAAAAVAARIAQSVAYSIIFLVSFTVINLLWGLISHALNLVTRLPGLHFLNKSAGAVVGLLEGIVLLFVLAALSRLLGGLIPAEAIQQSHLLKFFMDAVPTALPAAPPVKPL